MNQPEQFDLVHDDIWAALRGLVSACGGSKTVGALIWPAKRKSDGWLDDCLNPDREAKLCLEEFIHLLRIGRDHGFHGAKHFLDDTTNYSRTQPVEPEDELTVLLRRYLSREERQEKTRPRIDALIERLKGRGGR